jgi:hypothetical protein
MIQYAGIKKQIQIRNKTLIDNSEFDLGATV